MTETAANFPCDLSFAILRVLTGVLRARIQGGFFTVLYPRQFCDEGQSASLPEVSSVNES